MGAASSIFEVMQEVRDTVAQRAGFQWPFVRSFRYTVSATPDLSLVFLVEVNTQYSNIPPGCISTPSM